MSSYANEPAVHVDMKNCLFKRPTNQKEINARFGARTIKMLVAALIAELYCGCVG